MKGSCRGAALSHPGGWYGKRKVKTLRITLGVAAPETNSDAICYARGSKLRHSCNRFQRLANWALIALELQGAFRYLINGDSEPIVGRAGSVAGADMALRGLTLLLAGVLLAGCVHAQLEPASEASMTARDKKLLANAPYAKASIPQAYQRGIVKFHRKEAPGTVVVDSDARYLYYVLPDNQAIRYGVIVGEEAQSWTGVARVGRKEEWPGWTPTAGEKQRLGPLPNYVEGGPANPMGARGIYLYSSGKDTLYRIHGTNQPEWIGHAISSGCIRMTNEDVIDLYNHVKMGTIVVMLGPRSGESRVATADPRNSY